MKEHINYLSTLFVGIDIASRIHVISALDFNQDFYIRMKSFENNKEGAGIVEKMIADVLADNHQFKYVVIGMESTGFYGVHLANYLSASELLAPFSVRVYCLNPKEVKNYKKSFNDIGKNDGIDSFVIADFARVGRIAIRPWRGSQYLALQRLTRHRMHITECITREKTYMLNNIYLKFSEYALLRNGEHPFSNKYGATAEAILDKCLYEPLTISIASSFNCISSFEKELKAIDKAILQTVQGLNPEEYTVLNSIPGIGKVYSAGILAEIGSIKAFQNANQLAKYCGIVWNDNDSGDFESEDSRMSKAGNRYLRYYVIEAAGSVINHCPEYKAFYQKKYAETRNHQHKRALALTSRKFIRLLFGLLDKGQLYSPEKSR